MTVTATNTPIKKISTGSKLWVSLRERSRITFSIARARLSKD